MIRLIVPVITLLALTAALMPSQPALARNHCMRIHAVMAGFNGDNNVQYVELRMFFPLQDLLTGHTIHFYDGSGIVKAAFTFPTNISNSTLGDSILIATQEFNAVSEGADADFVFSTANTVAFNGGDPLHPIQGPSGKVAYRVGVQNCPMPQDGPFVVDSVAYGNFTGTVDFGTAAEALPTPSDNRALRLKSLASDPAAPGEPVDNSKEYSLEPVSETSYAVPVTNLTTDRTTPRNNSRVVAALRSPHKVSGGGSVDGSDPIFSATGELLSLPAIVASVNGGGERATFGFAVRAGASGSTGNLHYVDDGAGVEIKATSIDRLVINGSHAEFGGTALVNGASKPFRVVVDDLGEPGTADTFRIEVQEPGGYSNGPKTLIGGNIKIHR